MTTARPSPHDGDGGPLSFIDRLLPSWCQRRVVVVEPGQALAFDEAEWAGAIVVVERGEIDLEGTGSSGRFGPGAVLWLTGMALRTLRNRGGEPAVLVAVTRRPPQV